MAKTKTGRPITKRYLAAWGMLNTPAPDTPAEYTFTKPIQRAPRAQRQYPEQTDVHMPLVVWARSYGLTDYIMHLPNGGKKSLAEGARLKAMGVMAGASDLFLAKPVPPYAGFWLELKAPGKKPNPAQLNFLATMSAAGYMTGWYDDWVVARNAILRYLSGG